MKAKIKQLVKEIDEVLEKTAIGNEMDALIDYGEWSGSGPDFTDLVKKWNLDRATLLTYTDIAYACAIRFNTMKPIQKEPRKGFWPGQSFNPWEERYRSLNCIFMAGLLQE